MHAMHAVEKHIKYITLLHGALTIISCLLIDRKNASLEACVPFSANTQVENDQEFQTV